MKLEDKITKLENYRVLNLLTDWETSFIDSISKKMETYPHVCHLTPNQRNKIEILYENYK